MATSIGKLALILSANSSEFVAGVAAARAELKTFGQAVDKTMADAKRAGDAKVFGGFMAEIRQMKKELGDVGSQASLQAFSNIGKAAEAGFSRASRAADEYIRLMARVGGLDAAAQRGLNASRPRMDIQPAVVLTNRAGLDMTDYRVARDRHVAAVNAFNAARAATAGTSGPAVQFVPPEPSSRRGVHVADQRQPGSAAYLASGRAWPQTALPRAPGTAALLSAADELALDRRLAAGAMNQQAARIRAKRAAAYAANATAEGADAALAAPPGYISPSVTKDLLLKQPVIKQIKKSLTSPEFQADISAGMAMIPAHISAQLAKAGYQLVTSKRLADAYPELAGISPPGHFGDEPKGYFHVGRRQMSLSEEHKVLGTYRPSAGVPGTVVHETGHAFDELLGINNGGLAAFFNRPLTATDEKFKAAYRADLEKMSLFQKRRWDYLISQPGHPGTGEKEAFAFAFSHALKADTPYGGGAAHFSKDWTNTAAYVRSLMGLAEERSAPQRPLMPQRALIPDPRVLAAPPQDDTAKWAKLAGVPLERFQRLMQARPDMSAGQLAQFLQPGVKWEKGAGQGEMPRLEKSQGLGEYVLKHGQRQIGAIHLGEPNSMEAKAARRMFPDQVKEGAKVSRIHGIDLVESMQGRGLGQKMYLEGMKQAGADWYYNSQTYAPATNALKALAKKGLAEVHWYRKEPGWNEEGGPHIVRLMEQKGAGVLAAPPLSGGLAGFPPIDRSVPGGLGGQLRDVSPAGMAALAGERAAALRKYEEASVVRELRKHTRLVGKDYAPEGPQPDPASTRAVRALAAMRAAAQTRSAENEALRLEAQASLQPALAAGWQPAMKTGKPSPGSLRAGVRDLQMQRALVVENQAEAYAEAHLARMDSRVEAKERARQFGYRRYWGTDQTSIRREEEKRMDPARARIMEENMRPPLLEGMFKNLRENFASLAIQGYLAYHALRMVKGVLENFVTTGAEFDYQIKRLQVLTRASGSEAQAVEQQVLGLARTGISSQMELARAGTRLAVAGLTPAEIQQTLPTVSKLALVSGEDPAKVGESFTVALKAMQIPASEAARVGDVLALASTKSLGTVEHMLESYKFAAPYAKAAGLSLEELSASLAVLSNAGLKGELGGTVMRGMLKKVAHQSEETASVMRRLGISFEDAKGKFIGMGPALQMLTDRTKDLGDLQKVAVLSEIFDARAATGVLRLTQASGEYQKMHADLLRAAREGLLSKETDELMDTMLMKINRMKNAWTQVKITIAAAMAPLTEAALDKITRAFRGDKGAMFAAGIPLLGGMLAGRKGGIYGMAAGAALSSTADQAGGLGTVASYTATGAGVGSLVPGVGTALGAMIGAAVGSFTAAVREFKEGVQAQKDVAEGKVPTLENDLKDVFRQTSVRHDPKTQEAIYEGVWQKERRERDLYIHKLGSRLNPKLFTKEQVEEEQGRGNKHFDWGSLDVYRKEIMVGGKWRGIQNIPEAELAKLREKPQGAAGPVDWEAASKTWWGGALAESRKKEEADMTNQRELQKISDLNWQMNRSLKDEAEAARMAARGHEELYEAHRKGLPWMELESERVRLSGENLKKLGELEVREKFIRSQIALARPGAKIGDDLASNLKNQMELRDSIQAQTQAAVAGEKMKVWEETRLPMEKHASALQRLDALVVRGGMDWDTYQRAVRKAGGELDAAQGSMSAWKAGSALEAGSSQAISAQNQSRYGEELLSGRQSEQHLRDMLVELAKLNATATDAVGGAAGIGALIRVLLGGEGILANGK